MTTHYHSSIIVGVRAALLAALFCSVAAAAQAKTYTYTGTGYTRIVSGDCLLQAQHVTASFTVAGKLPPNSLYLPVTPLKWKMSNGVNTATNKKQSGSQVIVVSTDAKSRITGWALSAQYLVNGDEYIQIQTENFPEAQLVGDLGFDGACPGEWAEASTATPGTW